MRLVLLGVRGSTPAPGSAFVRYGGHTSCIAVTAEGQSVPSLVLDAGTGLRSLTQLLEGAPFHGSILLSHLHWDHAQGLPFFAAGDRDDAVVDLYCPAQEGLSGRDLLARLMSPPIFPITPEGLKGAWRFEALEAGPSTICDMTVTAFDVTHKGGRTFGYRLASGDVSAVYVPDHARISVLSDEVVRHVSGADVLLHDAQFLACEQATAEAYGHCTIDDAIQLAVSAGVSTLVLFHHGPARTDDQLDAIVEALPQPSGLKIVAAREGETIEVATGA